MADTPDTPPAATEDTQAPAPRRRAPRKATPKGDAAPVKSTPARRAAAKRTPKKDAGLVATAGDALQKVEDRTAGAVRATRGAATRTAKRAEDAVVGTARKAGSAVGVVKPRSSKRTTTRTAAKRPASKQASTSAVTRVTDKVGGPWGAAAIAGGLAAAGAAAAALFTLRSSTPKQDGESTPPTGKGVDSADASKSLPAGTTDENTAPN